jgi:hypothetical protein
MTVRIDPHGALPFLSLNGSTNTVTPTAEARRRRDYAEKTYEKMVFSEFPL